jgi:imidazolonepropionase
MTETILCDLAICRLRQVASPAGDDAPLRGEALGAIDVIEGDVWIAAHAGVIVAVGQGYDLRDRLELSDDALVVDAEGLVAVPGLVDCHTHACFAGDRVAEFELRSRGASYEELHAAGGGILATVRATREADLDELERLLTRRLEGMLACGTTTAEVKSGYGLDTETELQMLRAIRSASAMGPQRLHATLLGAHAVPPEARDADEYLDRCIAELLPEVDDWGLATSADVFLERGAFDAAQARRYLDAAAELGLTLRLHGDQFSEMGAIPLAIELGARSVDHLEATGAEGVAALAASDVTGVVLPTAALTLRRPMPPARALVDAGGAIAIATDLNPGSSPCDSLPLAMSLACTQMGLSPGEALGAVTVNAAHVLGEGSRLGRLQPGYAADVVLLAAPDWRHLAYHVGSSLVRHVTIDGMIALDALGSGRSGW